MHKRNKGKFDKMKYLHMCHVAGRVLKALEIFKASGQVAEEMKKPIEEALNFWLTIRKRWGLFKRVSQGEMPVVLEFVNEDSRFICGLVEKLIAEKKFKTETVQIGVICDEFVSTICYLKAGILHPLADEERLGNLMSFFEVMEQATLGWSLSDMKDKCTVIGHHPITTD